MKKIKLTILLFISVSLSLPAQTTAPDLAQIIASAKSQYVKSEALDKLQQDLRYFDEHTASSKEQQDQLLETYRSIASGYSLNNHFKQGYGVYQKYLGIKEGFLSTEKTNTIAKANSDIKDKQQKDENELISMQNQVMQLQLDNEYLLSKRKSFRHYFSLGIIALTIMFAFILLQAGLKLNKLNQDLKSGRERLKAIHRISALGKLKRGIILIGKNLFNSIKNSAAETTAQLDKIGPPADSKSNEIVNLRKQLGELNRLSQ